MKSMIRVCAMLVMITYHLNLLSGSTSAFIKIPAYDCRALQKNGSLSSMEALDLVKMMYAANFEKIYYADSAEYYYKLPFADYYLVYEGEGETNQEYLFHLYEFVVDDPDTGNGHTVTYGWYTVYRDSFVHFPLEKR